MIVCDVHDVPGRPSPRPIVDSTRNPKIEIALNELSVLGNCCSSASSPFASFVSVYANAAIRANVKSQIDIVNWLRTLTRISGIFISAAKTLAINVM